MRGLISDRFLRRFASDLKYRRKLLDSTGEGQNLEGGVDAAPEPEIVRSDSNASEENHEEAAADATVADTNDVPSRVEPNTQNEPD